MEVEVIQPASSSAAIC